MSDEELRLECLRLAVQVQEDGAAFETLMARAGDMYDFLAPVLITNGMTEEAIFCEMFEPAQGEA
jgi:hypothetical protein